MAVTRRIVAGVALAFIGFFLFLTLHDAIENGVSVLTVVSVGVLALFLIGIVGALAQPPDD